MKKTKFFFLTLLAGLLMSVSAGAQTATFKPSTTEPGSGTPEHQYYLHISTGNAGDYFWGAGTKPRNVAKERGTFAFYKVADRTDDYYIYSVTDSKWLSYNQASSYSKCRGFVQLVESKPSNYWNITKSSNRASKECYSISPYTSGGSVASIYLNYWQGASASANKDVSIGLYGTKCTGDDGSGWAIENAIVFSTAEDPIWQTWYMRNNGKNGGYAYYDADNDRFPEVHLDEQPTDAKYQFAFIGSLTDGFKVLCSANRYLTNAGTDNAQMKSTTDSDQATVFQINKSTKTQTLTLGGSSTTCPKYTYGSYYFSIDGKTGAVNDISQGYDGQGLGFWANSGAYADEGSQITIQYVEPIVYTTYNVVCTTAGGGVVYKDNNYEGGQSFSAPDDLKVNELSPINVTGKEGKVVLDGTTVTVTYMDLVTVSYTFTDAAGNQFEGTYETAWNGDKTAFPTFAGCEQLTYTNSVFAESAGTYTCTATIQFPFPISKVDGAKTRTIIQSGTGNSQWYNNNGNAVANNTTKYTSNPNNFSWYIYPVLNGNTFTFQLYNVGAAKYIPSNISTSASTVCTLTDDASSIGAYQFQAVRTNEYGFYDASQSKFITINSSKSTDQNLWLWTASGSHAGSTMTFFTITAYTVSVTNAPDANAGLVVEGTTYKDGEQVIVADGSTFSYTGYDGKIAKISFDGETANVAYRDLANAFFRMHTRRNADWVSINAAETTTRTESKSGTLTDASIWHFTATGTEGLNHLQNLKYMSYLTPTETFNTAVVTTLAQPAAADGWKLTKDAQGGVDYWMVLYDNSTDANHKAQLNQSSNGDKPLLNWYNGYPTTGDTGSEFLFEDVTDEVNAQYDIYYFNIVAGGEYDAPTSVTCSKQMGSQSVAVYNGGFVAYTKGSAPASADFSAYGYEVVLSGEGNVKTLTCNKVLKSYTIQYNYSFNGTDIVDTESFSNQMEGNAFPTPTHAVDYYTVAKPEGVIPGTEAGGSTLQYTITYAAIPEQPYPFTISTKDNPVWYFIKMRDNAYAYYDADGTDNRMTPVSSTKEYADKYRWAFVGTPAGFKIINKAAGTSVELYTTQEGSGKYNNYFQAEGTEYITMYAEPNEGRPIYIKTKNSSHYYINKNEGFYYWDNASALGEIGSAMTFEDANPAPAIVALRGATKIGATSDPDVEVIYPEELSNTPAEIDAAIDVIENIDVTTATYAQMDEVLNDEGAIVADYRSKVSTYGALATVNFTFGAEYGTLMLPSNVAKPESMTIYSCAGVKADGKTLDMTEVGSFINNTPYIVKGTEGDQFQFIGYDKSPADKSTVKTAGVLNGVYQETSLFAIFTKAGSSNTAYVLTKTDAPESRVVFQYLEEDASSTVFMGANRCFLLLPNGTEVKGTLYFDEETGIANVDANADVDGAIFNLAGQKINKLQKGVNIVNGKKVLF